MSGDYGARPSGVDIDEIAVIARGLVAAFPKVEFDYVTVIMIAIQLQRNAILNDTAIINGNIADAISDLVQANAMADYIPGERKN